MILTRDHNGEIDVSIDGRELDSFKEILKLDNSKELLKYLYYMYHPDSEFSNMLPGSRKKLVEREIIGHAVKETAVLKRAIETYNEICMDPKQLLLEGVKKKIEEYINFWQNTPIDIDNHDKLTKALVNSEKLLAIKKKMEDDVMDARNAKVYGGGSASMFEND